MDDSARLRAEVERRAARALPPRAPIAEVINTMAARQGVNIRRMNDPEHGDRLLAEADRALHRERIERQSEIMLRRLPVEYRNADFPRADFGRHAFEWLTDYRTARAAGTSPRSLVILGPTGTGKTWTACAIARALLTIDVVPCMVITVKAMLDAIRPGHDGLDADFLQFSLTPVLVLDDLGAEKVTDWAAEQLYGLSHERSHNGRPTIVTSNLTGEQIKERYDRRTVERLFGGAQLISIDGPTRRPMPF